MAGGFSSGFSGGFDVSEAVFVPSYTPSGLYSFIVEDEAGDIVAALRNVMAPQYNRSRNSADQMSLELPRTDGVFSKLLVGRRIEIQRLGQYEASGYITDRGYDTDTIHIEAQTEEIVLQRYLTPVQFGYPLSAEYATLDTFVNNIRDPYTTLRIKHMDQYNAHLLSKYQIDLTASSEVVYMERVDEDNYHGTGHLVLRFSADDFDDWDRWDRVRWVAEYDDNVKVSFSYRSGNTVTEANGAPFSTPIAGALTDVVGFIPPNRDHEVLDVKFDFLTTDTSLSANLFAVEVIARQPSAILLGSIPPEAASVSVPTIAADGANFLDVMIDLFDQVDWEFRIRQNQLDIAESFGTDRTNEFTLIAG